MKYEIYNQSDIYNRYIHSIKPMEIAVEEEESYAKILIELLRKSPRNIKQQWDKDALIHMYGAEIANTLLAN